jgi:RNA polymerase sigma-70 factor (ECF subfamily)
VHRTQDNLLTGKAAFHTTRWSLVAAATAAAEPTANANQALAELCQTYWYPLYAFVRRRGHAPEDACDLTQGFFTRLIEKNDLAAADQSRGRFRTFLLCALANFLCNHRDHERALKRGGDRTHVSLTWDADDAESRYQREPTDGLTPEKLFDRQWALSLLDRVLSELRDEYERAGNRRLFDGLKGTLTFAPDAPGHEQIAAELDMTAGAVKVAVHRLRSRYRRHLRGTIADSVESDQDVDDEIRHLFHVLSNGGT